jgi:hypothetical protein
MLGSRWKSSRAVQPFPFGISRNMSIASTGAAALRMAATRVLTTLLAPVRASGQH